MGGKMFAIGIDPGLDGGIAILKGEKVFGLYDIPTIEERMPPTAKSRKKAKKLGERAKDRKRRRYNINAMVEIFKALPAGDCFAILETVQSMPGQGVVSQQSMGIGFGIYQGILASHYISYEKAHPKKWQKEFGISGDTKSKAFQVATRIFPKLELATPKGVILTGRCDSILIAEYARRKYKNELVV